MTEAASISRTILEGFDKHYRIFRSTSSHAKERWERRDWAAVRNAWQERIDLYDQRVLESVAAISERFPNAIHPSDDARWAEVKVAYIALLYERDHKQPECAETFFNSVIRRVLDRRYYGSEQIFRRAVLSTEHLDGREPVYQCHYPRDADLTKTFAKILAGFGLVCGFRNLAEDAKRLATILDLALGPRSPSPTDNFQIHVLRSLFFRNKSAYVVGRALHGGKVFPFVIPLVHDDFGDVSVDALILDETNLARVFSLGRAYFMVDMEVPSAYVSFLETIVPRKPRAELYTMLGLQKQGKTLFFRDLEQHLNHSSDRFVLAAGTKGMVMAVFTLPSFPYVFKIIRDWFLPPKDCDRAHVEERYEYVKKQDRVGRMADTLEYADVAFPKDRFEPGVIEELTRVAASSIDVQETQIVIKHLYSERRLIPLDLYLANASEAQRREAIDEYGNAIKDLAGSDIFPGDLLLKNFGVTRYGRVIFYDYDEITSVTSCRFRSLPKPRDDDDEYAPEPWFSVEQGDVFPEQFPRFIFPEGPLRDLFVELHGELADARFWSRQQQRLHEGIQEDVYPYARAVRFT